MKKYKIVYADPAWKFNNKNTGGSMVSGADAHYSTMTIDQICKMPINEIADENAVLFMWWVASMPLEALQVVSAWGFKLKTMSAFTWVKLTKKEKLSFGMGFWTRQGSENCLVAVKGNIKRVNAAIRNVVLEENTAFETNEVHSKKPAIFRDKIVELMGDVPRVELFARAEAAGWDVWGNQAPNSITLDVEPAAVYKVPSGEYVGAGTPDPALLKFATAGPITPKYEREIKTYLTPSDECDGPL